MPEVSKVRTPYVKIRLSNEISNAVHTNNEHRKQQRRRQQRNALLYNEIFCC